MPRTAARITQADVARVLRAVAQSGLRAQPHEHRHIEIIGASCMTPNPKQPHKLAGRHWQQKPALTQIIEIIGDRSDGCSRYGLIAPPSVAARQNGGGHG